VEFKTSRGTVLVSGSDDVIATLEEALAQARSASAGTAHDQAA
jgi:hypothetical protein